MPVCTATSHRSEPSPGFHLGQGESASTHQPREGGGSGDPFWGVNWGPKVSVHCAENRGKPPTGHSATPTPRGGSWARTTKLKKKTLALTPIEADGAGRRTDRPRLVVPAASSQRGLRGADGAALLLEIEMRPEAVRPIALLVVHSPTNNAAGMGGGGKGGCMKSNSGEGYSLCTSANIIWLCTPLHPEGSDRQECSLKTGVGPGKVGGSLDTRGGGCHTEQHVGWGFSILLVQLNPQGGGSNGPNPSIPSRKPTHSSSPREA